MGAFCCCFDNVDYEGEVDLRHFELLQIVGKGAFGKVRIVRKRNDSKIYALKYIDKMKCIEMKATSHIIEERKLLQTINHPFIVNLRYAFQDDENLFMVLDLMLGGDLRFLFDRTGPMKEHQVRFYVAEIGSALRHLNENSICHRDIKPDNILLDREGHAHLTDFNIAVKFNRDKPMKSIAGSLAYIAPEVLNGNGYIESEDWWSLGVVMYELLFGKRPFHGKHNDLLINSILNDPLTFPVDHDKTISKECVAFLQELLNRNISKRLGVGEINWLTFKQHEFMKMELEGEQPIDWKKLYNKQIKPPFTPDSSKANFDAGHELNEFINENKTLRIHGKGQIDYSMLPGGADGQIAKSLKLMEAKFTNYNFERKAEVLSSSPSNSTSNIDQPCIELEDTKQADTALAQTKT